MGIDVIACVGSSIVELSGDMAVYCLIQEGDLELHGRYSRMVFYDHLPFVKTAARRR